MDTETSHISPMASGQPQAHKTTTLDPRAALLLLICAWVIIIASPTDVRLAIIGAVLMVLAQRCSCFTMLLRRMLFLLPMSIGLGVYMYFVLSSNAASELSADNAAREALFLSVSAVSRMLLIAAAAVFFGFVVPVQNVAAALRTLRFPDTVVSILWMTERLFHLLTSDARRMLEALRIRSVRLSLPMRIRTIARLSATFIVRSITRSDRIADALLVRGFDGRIPIVRHLRWRISDTIASIAAVGACIASLCLPL